MSAKPTLVLAAVWCESKGEAEEVVDGLFLAGEPGAGATSLLAAEDLDLPGMRRLLARLGLDGVVPE